MSTAAGNREPLKAGEGFVKLTNSSSVKDGLEEEKIRGRMIKEQMTRSRTQGGAVRKKRTVNILCPNVAGKWTVKKRERRMERNIGKTQSSCLDHL